jgi:UDPglucose 6-dehydrogenase
LKVGIIGTGYVGLVSGACFAEFGVRCLCIDKDLDRIRLIQKGEIPFYEPGLGELVQKNIRDGRLRFGSAIREATDSSDVLFIAVGTPPRGDGSADLSYVEEVAGTIADCMTEYKVIVTKSTVPVGTGRRIREIMTERLKGTVDFDVASNPEFLREGSAIEDFMRPNRVVIGTESDKAARILKDLYNPLYLIETPFIVTDVPTAEMIKYASNAFLATKVSFINEIANLCEAVGADVHVVSKGMGLDGRIGPKFLHPGPGFGGSCLPKDTRAIAQVARSKGKGYELEVVEAAIRANIKQKDRMLEKIVSALGSLEGKTLGILGLSFKPNTDDIREAVTIKILQDLIKQGARIRAYDPAAMASAKDVLPEVEYCQDAYAVAERSDALVLMTEWNQFRNLDLDRIKGALLQPIFIDLRNVYQPDRMKESGFRYFGVGRGVDPADNR